MKLSRFSIIAIGLAMTACTNDLEDLSALDNTKIVPETTINKYHISPDSALLILNEFLNENNTVTRANKSKSVSSIIPLSYKVHNTRNDEEINFCENLIYVANFENKEGYAILAADKRIEDKVLAITDEGSLSEEVLHCAANIFEERDIIEGYPTTGPGFFTTPETGDEVFINPNTVNLYDETKEDTLVGNFNEDDEDPFKLSYEFTDGKLTSPELISCGLCIYYAVNQIQTFDIDYPEEEDNEGNEGPGGNTEESSSRIVTTTTEWSIKNQVEPLLIQFKGWHQESPFNDLYPERRKYLFLGKKRRAHAGCFPLSIAKIMCYLEFPSTFINEGYKINWVELKTNFNSDNFNFNTNDGKLSAANLLRKISTGCNSLYFYAGTFTFHFNASSFMRNIGINNAHNHSYSFERVTNMLDNEKPLIIYSIPGINIFASHCWNIDGYKVKERTIIKKHYYKGQLVNTQEEIEISKMVHCDFGWKGGGNGYYVSGIFKLNDSNAELDPGPETDKTTNYNHFIHLITY